MFDSIRTWINRARFRMSSKSREHLWKRLASLADGDVPIAVAMEFLADSRNRDTAYDFCNHQIVALRTKNFAEAAVGWIPQEELIMIELTQEGRISEGFKQAARIASVRTQLRSTLFSNLTYPVILLFVGATIIAVLPPYAMQMMQEITPVENWPSVSKSVLEFSNFVQNWGLHVLVTLFLLISVSVWAAPRLTGPIRNRLEWYPPFALYRQLLGPEVLVAWLALMRAGVQRLRALDQLSRGMPAYIASHIQIMRSRMYAGENTDIALDTGLFTPETLDDLRIYERLGSFSEQAENVSTADIERTLARFRATTRILSAVFMLIVGGAAIWIYIGIARLAFTLQNTSY